MAPDFTAEITLAMTDEQRFAWFRDKARIFTEDGATWHRFSHDPDNPDRLFYDGWRERPPDSEAATDDAYFLGLANAAAA